MSMQEIAVKLNFPMHQLYKAFGIYDIPRRNSKDHVKMSAHKAMNTKLEKYGYKVVPPEITRQSKGELEVKEFLNSFGFNFSSTRAILSNNLELDLYDDKLKLAIEYNGCWYHSELFKTRNYHYDKWKECRDKGIRLIHIFDNEWYNKTNQVKNFLRSSCGSFDNRVYARNCEIKEIVPPREFLNQNHLQGYPNKPILSYGIFNDGELCGVVTYGKHHRNNRDIVLSRLAFKPNIQIIGGASKLIKNSLSLSNFDTVITWSDNRWSTGSVYNKCGFIIDKEYPPDYFYTSGDKIMSKQSQQKQLTRCPENLTEHEWAKERGLYRIFDCGKTRWIWSK